MGDSQRRPGGGFKPAGRRGGMAKDKLAGGVKKIKKKKDPNRPKRAMPAFMFYSIENRSGMKSANPDLGIGEVSKLLGANWRTMTDDEKEADKERYKKEMETYVPPPETE